MADTCGESLDCTSLPQKGMAAIVAASYVRLADGPNGELRTARRTASCTGGEPGGGTVQSISIDADRLISGSSDGSPTAPALTLQAAGLLRNISKVGHGFTVGQAIRVSAAGVSDLAQGDSAANARFTGFVFLVDNANIFTLALPGSYLESGFSGLTARELYYLDPTTPGAITPTPNAFGPVLRASSATGGYVLSNADASGIKIYRVNISQSGSDPADAPVINRTYENTLGGTPVFTRASNGNYPLTLSGAFTANKTFVLGGFMASTGDLVMIQPEHTDANVVTINSFLIDLAGATFTPSDDTINNFDLQILVYP